MMGSDSASDDSAPTLQDVLTALDDPDCRTILVELTEPMTAKTLQKTCDIPKSTLYRKLDVLSEADLVRELVEIVPEGGRITRYQRDVTDVTISVDDDEAFTVSIDRPARTADERLAAIWSDLGDEL